MKTSPTFDHDPAAIRIPGNNGVEPRGEGVSKAGREPNKGEVYLALTFFSSLTSCDARMNRIDHTREGPNIAGVSLALYLLVSILSMMALYEIKASDDVRNSVVLSLQSSSSSPTKSGDEGEDDPVLSPSIDFVAIDSGPFVERSSVAYFQPCSFARGFNARGPPKTGAPAA